VDVLDIVRRISDDTANFGPDAAEKALRALSAVADEPVVVDALKVAGTRAGSATSEAAMDGLATMAKIGVDPQKMVKILKRQDIVSDSYRLDNLLADTGELREVGGLWKTLDDMANCTSQKGRGVPRGISLEIQNAAAFKRAKKHVEHMRRNIPFAQEYSPKPGSTRAWASRTDIDFKADGIRCDSKLNAKNIKTRNAINWIHAAAHEAGGPPDGYRKVKILVPNVGEVPNALKQQLNSIAARMNLADGDAADAWKMFFDVGLGD